MEELMFRKLLLTTTLLPSFALAAPPPGPIDPEMGAWYESLRQPETGRRCCSISDCRSYVSRINKDHYEIFLHNRWFTVPEEVILHRENKTGMAVACLRTSWHGGTPPSEYDPGIMCYVPAPET